MEKTSSFNYSVWNCGALLLVVFAPHSIFVSVSLDSVGIEMCIGIAMRNEPRHSFNSLSVVKRGERKKKPER